MASVSVSINRGDNGFQVSQLTVGTLATNANDIEVRVNLADALGGVVTDKDVKIALEAFIRYFQTGKNLGGATSPVL